MTATVYTLTQSWSATNRYTAAAAIDVALGNPSAHWVRYTRTTTDTLPVIDVANGFMLQAFEKDAFKLLLGERLWMASGSGPIGNTATLET